jgi:hypothetical protein
MVEYVFDTNAEDIARAFERYPKRLVREMGEAMTDIGDAKKRRMQSRFTGYSPTRAGAGSRLMRRSGALAQSFTTANLGAASRLNGLGVAMGTDKEYAPIQEEGGTVKAKPGKYLTIPLDDALTPAGVVKGGARLRKSGGKWQTADGKPTFIRNGVIFAKYGKTDRSLRALYVLKKQVKIPPRLGMFRMFERLQRKFIPHRIGQAVSSALEKGAARG